MSSLWWWALALLTLPIWWHRQKRERLKAEPLATARFLPRANPQQQRVWAWVDRALLLARCLLLACAIAWLADLVLPWRGDTVLVGAGVDPAWAERQIADAGFKKAARIDLPAGDALAWLRVHEREWHDDARLLVVASQPMQAVVPRFRHRVELRSMALPPARSEHRVAIVSERAEQWRAMFAALDGPRRYLIETTPSPKTELVIWDVAQAPPVDLRAPLWWVGDTAAFPELGKAASVDGLRYADSARGRLWSAAPPMDAGAARSQFETWQRLHYPPVPFTAPSQVFAADPSSPITSGSGALRHFLGLALLALFALERTLTHARRN
ncbi:BatA domain-containing protein [Massilia glaciei]|uniref:Aerotolerance regulator N-terminal domain-containing protein n=1 Tax=Massilia glaciei TaxID=1524097 RepID=A0A2U2HJG8_9BURK|nr:BatA domain-containing protein [Massilia glaciei]PWF47592.1 hypothetical protein C7C56_014685 [Massilia glaciei]